MAGNCYKKFDRDENWGNAQAYCRKELAHADLASINSEYEHSYVKRVLGYENPGDREDYWIGLNDRLTSGNFIWSDGSRLTFNQGWNEGEPNNIGIENCVEYDGVLGGWNDDDCSTRQPFLCKARASRDESGQPEIPILTTPAPNRKNSFSF